MLVSFRHFSISPRSFCTRNVTGGTNPLCTVLVQRTPLDTPLESRDETLEGRPCPGREINLDFGQGSSSPPAERICLRRYVIDFGPRPSGVRPCRESVLVDVYSTTSAMYLVLLYDSRDIILDQKKLKKAKKEKSKKYKKLKR